MLIWALTRAIPLFFLFFFLRRNRKTDLDKKEQSLKPDVAASNEGNKFAPTEENEQTRRRLGAIIIDMQDYFMDEEKLKMAKAQIPVISFCRKNDIPIAIINYCDCGPIIASLAEETSGLPIFEKNRDDAFSQKKFQEWIEENQVESLIIMGVNACACVFETANSALKNGYQVITDHKIIGGYCGCSDCTGGKPEWYDKNTIPLKSILRVDD